HTTKLDYNSDSVFQLAMQIFNKLPECQHSDLLSLIQDALDAANYKEIKISKIKHKYNHPSNNKHICNTFENIVKKPKVEKLDDNNATMSIKLVLHISQNTVSE
ncbi:16623_t:CDS:2, partial [Dentiscutata heterogama]